jgi:hypothetical protein
MARSALATDWPHATWSEKPEVSNETDAERHPLV